FLGRQSTAPVSAEPAHPLLRAVRDQLTAYFAGELTAFDLPIELRGSPFQRQVWQTLLEIPYGYTWTYKQVSEHVADPASNPRTVGAIVGQNPIPIVVPCHRVIGADGTLVGFGGGLSNKRVLLELEARVRIQHEFAP
ncbi:MAG: methylated-DNA--[protein]-cysteine S-methyltransferase, partial [Streptosporangiales bacterium]|nr:methylated-DNA--[protein]-cysteine S-methyltransferase [Streptosporangiales bacterium]